MEYVVFKFIILGELSCFTVTSLSFVLYIKDVCKVILLIMEKGNPALFTEINHIKFIGNYIHLVNRSL